MAGLFKAGLNSSKVSAKFEFSFESLKSKFSLIQLIGSSSMEKAIRENTFEQKKKKLAIYFSPGLALIDRPTTGSRTVINQASIEWFSFECRKTKTKVITLANHIGHRQYIEPIKTRSNYMWLTQSAGKCMRARHNWLWFYF